MSIVHFQTTTQLDVEDPFSDFDYVITVGNSFISGEDRFGYADSSLAPTGLSYGDYGALTPQTFDSIDIISIAAGDGDFIDTQDLLIILKGDQPYSVFTEIEVQIHNSSILNLTLSNASRELQGAGSPTEWVTIFRWEIGEDHIWKSGEINSQFGINIVP